MVAFDQLAEFRVILRSQEFQVLTSEIEAEGMTGVSDARHLSKQRSRFLLVVVAREGDCGHLEVFCELLPERCGIETGQVVDDSVDGIDRHAFTIQVDEHHHHVVVGSVLGT